MFGANFQKAISRSEGKDVGRQIGKATKALEVLRDLIVGTSHRSVTEGHRCSAAWLTNL